MLDAASGCLECPGCRDCLSGSLMCGDVLVLIEAGALLAGIACRALVK